MKYWPAILSATTAAIVAIPTANELLFNNPETQHITPLSRQTDIKSDASEPLGTIDTSKTIVTDTRVTAPAGPGKTAVLTINPSLQRAATTSLQRRHIAHGAVVAMDIRTGEILAYASRHNNKADPITTARLPATDIAKTITATATLKTSDSTHTTRICHRDPGTSLDLQDLVSNKTKDTWCPTLAESIGRNLDAPIAKAALHLTNHTAIEQAASAFGFGQILPFDLPVEASHFSTAHGDEGLMRAAIGSENIPPIGSPPPAKPSTTMSAMQGLIIASIIGRKGLTVHPLLVRTVETSHGDVVYSAKSKPHTTKQVVDTHTANELAMMMRETTEKGEAFRAFHDETGHPTLGKTKIAAVFGAERVNEDSDQTTWLIGFVPSDAPEIAFATVAKNRKGSPGNAQGLAIDVLRAFLESPRKPARPS